MTLHAWTTTADVPPAAWAAMTHDMRTLLDSWASLSAAAVTGADGTGAPVLDEDTIGFAVALPGGAPLAVTFRRAAGDSSCTTNGQVTDGLVVVALRRAARHFGKLLTWTSEAGLRALAVADTLGDALYGAGDRAVTGAPAPTVPAIVDGVLAAARTAVDTGQAATYQLGSVAYLDALTATITEQRDGIAAATALLAPPAPAPVAARSWFATPPTP